MTFQMFRYFGKTRGCHTFMMASCRSAGGLIDEMTKFSIRNLFDKCKWTKIKIYLQKGGADHIGANA